MHAALAFRLLRKPSNNFLSELPEDQFWLFRRIIIHIVLGTDMALHMDSVKVWSMFPRNPPLPLPSLSLSLPLSHSTYLSLLLFPPLHARTGCAHAGCASSKALLRSPPTHITRVRTHTHENSSARAQTHVRTATNPHNAQCTHSLNMHDPLARAHTQKHRDTHTDTQISWLQVLLCACMWV